VDAPSLNITDVTVTEGNVGTVSATFTVSLSAPYNQEVSVVYATVNGSASAGSDYVAETDTLTFLPGETSKEVSIAVNGDRVYEDSEYFLVKLTGAVNAFVPDDSGAGVITNDEPILHFDYDASGPEGNTGTKEMEFTLTLSSAYDSEVTVGFATAELTPDEELEYGTGAKAGIDYTAVAGTVTFEIGQTEQKIKVPIIGDRLVEYYEVFFVNLSTASGAGWSTSRAVGTIVDDEPAISITGYVSLTEGGRGTKSMTFYVTLSNAYDQPVTVNYATQNGSATAGSDYVAKSGVLTFAPGETSKTFTVTINGDKDREADEYFYVLLTANSSNSRLSNSTGVGAILNDDGGKGPRR
jgi:hypothetical protein